MKRRELLCNRIGLDGIDWMGNEWQLKKKDTNEKKEKKKKTAKTEVKRKKVSKTAQIMLFKQDNIDQTNNKLEIRQLRGADSPIVIACQVTLLG